MNLKPCQSTEPFRMRRIYLDQAQTDEGGVGYLQGKRTASGCDALPTVDHFYATQKIFEQSRLPFDRRSVLNHHGPLQVVADRADLIEAVPAAVAFHPMAQHSDRIYIALFQAGLDRLEIALAIGEESGNDGFKIRIDMNNDPGLAGLRL